jgi:hypothetical protein
MNKYIIGAGAIAVALIFLSSTYSSDTPNISEDKTVSSSVVVVEEPYDFGDIDIFAGKVSTTYTLKNEGTEAVTIISAQTSCMCTEGEIDGLRFGMHGSEVEDLVIESGGEKILTAIYDPLAHGPNGTGKITRELMLKTNSENTPLINVKFSANVVKEEE